jgi:peroxiredoxin
MKRTGSDFAVVAAIAVLFCALCVVIYSSMQDRIVETGDAAPEFAFTTDQGLKITPAQFGGKVLVLNFWATWCGTCLEEIPSLNEFQRETASSGVVVVGVSVDRNEKLYHAFLKRFPVSFQTARDPEMNISAEFGTYKFPETYIIDRSGKVVQKIISSRNWMAPEIINFVKSLA